MGRDLLETELKFQIPSDALEAVRRAVATATARNVRLRARYLDTPDGRLAAAQMALRLRLEGDRWVQTVKAPGPSAVVRCEHEVLLDPHTKEPRVDIARHAGTPVGDALAAALRGGAGLLQVVFETDVQRTLRVVRQARALVEIALDVGEIIAGGRRLPVCELEFELKRGEPAALFELAGRWVQRHRLWLDVRSKAERGLALARGAGAVGANAPAELIDLKPDTNGDAALRRIVAVCLAEMLPAAAAVADEVHDPEPLHQLRVGLRRLRCALRLFGDKSDKSDKSDEGAAAPSAWDAALVNLFQRLGSTRNQDVFELSVFPALRAAGAPLVALPPSADSAGPGAAVRSIACTSLLLQLLRFMHAAAPDAAHAGDALRQSFTARVLPRMHRLRQRLQADAGSFMSLDDNARHRCRKRLKRWRYGLEFVASLYTPKTLQRCLARVRSAQDILGRYNDLATAERAFRALAEEDARAWFAVGWLIASREPLLPQAQTALAKLVTAAKGLRPAKHRAARRSKVG